MRNTPGGSCTGPPFSSLIRSRTGGSVCPVARGGKRLDRSSEALRESAGVGYVMGIVFGGSVVKDGRNRPGAACGIWDAGGAEVW